MIMSTEAESRTACESLSHAYGHHADAWEADLLANLFTPDGVFNRLGTKIEGRQAIRDFIANRPRDMWQIHVGRNFTFKLGADGRSATGTLDLEMARGKVGETQPSEVVHARYHDQFVLTDEGWKFKIREVVLIDR